MKRRLFLTMFGAAAAASALPMLSGCSKEGGEQKAAAAPAAQKGDDLLAAVKKKGRLVIAMEGTWSPWTYHDEKGGLTGYDVAVGRKIAEAIGVEPEFVEGKWDGLLAGLDAGRYDIMVNGVGITEARRAAYDFSEPYAFDRVAVIVLEKNDAIHSMADLKGKHTANTISSTYAEVAEKAGATVTGVDALNQTFELLLSGRIDAAALSIALFGACLAFLRYNFNPASIFLGDSGSLLLGFALGSISLLNVSRTAALTSLIIPLIVAGVPIIDTFSAIVRRKRAHISIGQADKGHIHHRLIQEGYNQKQAVLLIYAWCIMLSAGAAAINQVEVPMRVLIFTVLAIGSAAFAKHLHLFEPVLRHHYNKRTHEDELVTPDDPAFKQEEQAAEERKEERHHKL